MHMADALLSPAVGGVMWATTAGTIAWCAKKVQRDLDERKVPLMGVLGAFVFAAQMINFTIPATGSSGHLGGGLLLAILLGPYAAFLAIASVLTVQALFFADGGLLALGCNIFNLGVFPCFIAYPLIYRPIAGDCKNPMRIGLGATLAAVAGLQLGALGVVTETVLSGISALPLTTFLAAMLPIHLAIGLVEGLITTTVISFVWKARPEILEYAAASRPLGSLAITKVLAGLGVAAVLTGGVLSWFASSSPDGLEWSMAKTSGQEELKPPQDGIHVLLARMQEQTAVLPDYAFRVNHEGPVAAGEESAPSWPAVDKGTSTSGLVGGGLTLLLAVVVGLLCRRRSLAR
ncbi:cobalamin (vitamin B12) biosynthesis CbiM protein [Desulfobulbus propionicus DSM 2032]|jgi:cobalt/nickel transport system permease protein|uniref:Cobalamin (Vitamin B12) biosynthesis CbiM protein n=1 Tax=Desulfobulbus propionicus (strain ATCC 33891 / DSM 2032 / VKM B-1956 / 1pr3) TaxID=577650 RepID=A0A7U4DQM9_DESPD|nr:energy-coupling factor ABC transporter permease [Desulfobulbus propionicus]ADW19361.1 cobalamin (vitamin B12) biosynthesis CbiM protein [Desulfobulbus propionicus DSM 2032]